MEVRTWLIPIRHDETAGKHGDGEQTRREHNTGFVYSDSLYVHHVSPLSDHGYRLHYSPTARTPADHFASIEARFKVSRQSEKLIKTNQCAPLVLLFLPTFVCCALYTKFPRNFVPPIFEAERDINLRVCRSRPLS